MNFKDKISGIVLCGGLSRRMGSDKSQKKIGDLKLIDIVIEKATGFRRAKGGTIEKPKKKMKRGGVASKK